MKQFLIVAIATLFIMPAFAQQKKSPHDTVSTKDVKVTYGRPYKNNRVIFGGLVPYNAVWRLGADEATEITFVKDAKLNGQDVKAGTYTMFAIPGEKEWTIILNSQMKQWGAFGYDKVKDKDVLKTNVPVKSLGKMVEQFTIHFEKGNMIFEWDTTQVVIPVK